MHDAEDIFIRGEENGNPCIFAWQVCSERISITRPSCVRTAMSHWKLCSLAWKPPSSLLEANSYGKSMRKSPPQIPPRAP